MIEKCNGFVNGYNSLSEIDGKNANMFMDFGIIKLGKGENFSSTENEKERSFLLIEGDVVLKWENEEKAIKRGSCFDENPWCLHVPAGVTVDITANSDSELTYQAMENKKTFASKLYTQDEVKSQIFGEGVLNETSNRTVRTIIDADIAPYSNLVIGEVVNHPGRWSSYPPHYHVQPEIYHYRFLPEQGFGFSAEGDDAYMVKNGDTAMIVGDVSHPQTSAPGYAMYYVWLIPHMKDQPWSRETTYFNEEHKWLLEKDVKIWPER